ncbi:unnamed protein product, partial [Echinostoma caproni]
MDIIFGQSVHKSDSLIAFNVPEAAKSNRPEQQQQQQQQPEQEQYAQSAYYSQWDNLRAMSPEFFNLALVLMLLGLRYPSVFWYTSRAFSFVFSLLLLLTGLHVLIEFCAASVLVKLACNRSLLTTQAWMISLRLITNPVHRQSSSHMVNAAGGGDAVTLKDPNADGTMSDETADLNPLAFISPLALSTTGTLIFLCLFLTIFEYGYRQFTEDLATYRHYLVGSSSATGFGLVQTDPYHLMGDAVERR